MKISWDCVNHRSYFRHSTKNPTKKPLTLDDATGNEHFTTFRVWPTIIHHPCRPLLQCVCVYVFSPLPERSISHGLNAGWRGPGSSSWFLWTARDPAGWSTSSGGGPCRPISEVNTPSTKIYPLAPSNETALKSGSFSLHRSAQRSQPDQRRAEHISAQSWQTHVMLWSCGAWLTFSLGLNMAEMFLRMTGPSALLGEVDLVEGYQAPIGPVGRGAFLGFPRCFAF